MKKGYYVFKMNLTLLNIVALLLVIPPLSIAYFISPNLVMESLKIFTNAKTVLLFVPCMMGYLALHELLHALGYVIYGADPKKITFGMELEKGVLYCLCKQEVTRKNILNAVMWPLFYIGIVTFVISIIFNLPILLLLSIINISGAAGDIMYFIFLRKLDKNIMYSEMDDGTSFAILSEKDISKTKSFGLEFVEKVNEIPRNDFKRLKISKLSYLVLVLCLLFVLIAIFLC